MLSSTAQFINEFIDIFCCPKCDGEVSFGDEELSCINCQQIYQVSNGIPSLFWPNDWDSSKLDVTEDVKSFYEENPFPNYDDFDNFTSLVEKAKEGLFAKLLDKQIPFGSLILECGCGTGQLTNFLSVGNRTVIGTDLCYNSLRMAHDFKQQNDLGRAFFLQMNLFRPCFKIGTFDLVIANGVLHHTSDPVLGVKTIARLVKPRGYILLGLYHKYGRISNDMRRFIFRLTNDKLKFLDRRVVSENISTAKREAWFMDQYKNPHESKHTIGEVLHWLDEAGFTFIRSIPKTRIFERFHDSEKLFMPDEPGNWLERSIVEISMALTGRKEGGFFTLIAKKSH